MGKKNVLDAEGHNDFSGITNASRLSPATPNCMRQKKH